MVFSCKSASINVSPSRVPSKCIQIISPTYSWEFFTSLRYEWSVIQGRQPYRLAVWVRDDRLTLNLLSLNLSFP
jgi:hypothetical protein